MTMQTRAGLLRCGPMADSIPRQRVDRTQLQQIIVGLTEGIIIIDPDRTIAWANEKALMMHGVKAVKDLGSSISDYRSRFELRYRNRHGLEAEEYPMERVAAGEVFSKVVVEVSRSGEDRHWVHEIRSLVLIDPEGVPDCLVLVLEDQTERFNAEERFERAFGANPAPAIIARVSDMRYVKVNQGFLELTGYRREVLIGRSVYEIDILEGVEKRDLAVARLHTGATIPQMEACLRTADGSSKMVIVAGQPIEVGDAACMLFSFADLHPRKQAEDALRQSEQRFAVAFRLAPGPMAVLALDGLRLLDVNDAFTAATGWRREEVIGRTEPDIGLWGGASREELATLVKQTGYLHSCGRPAPDQGRPARRLPAFGRDRHHQRRALHPDRHAGHHRAQADRAPAAGRDRGGPARHLLVRAEDRGEARQPDQTRCGRPAGTQHKRPDGARPGCARTDGAGAVGR